MIDEIGDVTDLLQVGSSADHDAIATSELVASQYANLSSFRNYLADYNVDHTADIQNMGLWINNHLISAQDAYAEYRLKMVNYMNDDTISPEAVVTLTLKDKEDMSDYIVSVDDFMKDITSQCDTAAISSALLQQAAHDIQDDVVSTVSDMRSNIEWAVGALPMEVSHSLNTALTDIYSSVDSPLDLYYNIRDFIGLNAETTDITSLFDSEMTELGRITGASPIKSICTGVVTTYASLLKGAVTTIGKAIVHRYYVGKLLWTVMKESWRLQWKMTKLIFSKIGNKLRTTYVDPVDFECSKNKIGYFDVNLVVGLDKNNFSSYLSSANSQLLDSLVSYLNENGAATFELYGNEFQIGLDSNSRITIIHRQKPFDYASVVERFGRDLGSTSWTLSDFKDLNALYSRVSDMKKGTDENYILNSLSFARAHAGITLESLREVLEKIEETDDYGDTVDLSGVLGSWVNATEEKRLAQNIYQGYVFGKCMIDGTYPTANATHAVPFNYVSAYNDTYKEFYGSVNNSDFYGVLTSYTKATDNAAAVCLYGSNYDVYFEGSDKKVLLPIYKTISGTLNAVGRLYIDLALVAARILTQSDTSKLYNVSCIKYYRGTSRFKANTTIKTDKTNMRSALIFTGVVAGTALLTIAAIKLTPKLIEFSRRRRVLAEAYNTRNFNIGQKVLDGDIAGAMTDLKANRKVKRFLTMTGGTSGLISSGMSIAALDASGIIDSLNQSITTLNSKRDAESNVSEITGALEDVKRDVNDNTDDKISSVSSLIL